MQTEEGDAEPVVAPLFHADGSLKREPKIRTSKKGKKAQRAQSSKRAKRSRRSLTENMDEGAAPSQAESAV
jgi:hypothetical protein